MTDAEYMSRAISLAKLGEGKAEPNPLVGAVIVKNGSIIGEGWHQRYGEKHAERNALCNCSCSPYGATIYITLEPCCHTGHQPPCTEAIIESRIKRVVIGSNDPNPLVWGKSAEILREHGIEVCYGVMKKECDALNDIFFHYITNKTPYIAMKYAMTLDGKIATHTGASQWITGEAARKSVHTLRNRYPAIMAGVGTVLADDPMLNCRIEGGRNPIRIICDTHLRTPLDSKIVKTADKIRTVIACSKTATQNCEQLQRAGCELLRLPCGDDYRIDFKALIKELGEMKISGILLEGGATLNSAALKARAVNKIYCYTAPKIFGGAKAKSPIGGEGVDVPDEAYTLQNIKVMQIEQDILIEGEVKYPCSQAL